jgi:diguanylate cyclase (GGDEF)-like protein
MPASRRLTPRDRLLGVGLQTRLVAAAAVLVAACGGFLAYRSVNAIADAYRWTGEAEASSLAHSFARSLSTRDLDDVERIRGRIGRLSGVHPDLTGVDVAPAGADTAKRAAYRRDDRTGELKFPILDGSGSPVAVLRLTFSLDERAEALAAGRREVMLAGIGAGLLLVIGVGALSWLLLVRPLERLSRSALLLASGKPGTALGWRRRDAIGVLSGSIDALGGTMQALQARIEGLALKDPLTGVLNHRGLHDALHEALDRAADRREKVAVVVLDIDNFEQLNAATGHAAGDEALRIAARVILGELRPGDVCGRIGGDEFLLALPDSDAWGAERVVERLRAAVAAAPLSRPEASPALRSRRAGLAFSAGIAEFPRDARDQQGLMRLADGALYRAKRSGRNRCVVYSSFVDAPLSLQEEAERARTAGLANTVYALARAVDLKDGYTHQHSARVAQYAAVLARELSMSEEEIEQIRTAGILHDVGKVGVADAVLLKPARLTEDEFLEMQRHSTLGRDIIQGAGMPEIADWVLYLHERWDGRGYPHKLEGEDIPLASRVLGVADAFEAMTSSRLYRRGMPVEKALLELEKSAGQQFDPTVAQRMVDLVRAGAIPLGEIGVLDVTHYGSAASSESAAPPEEDGEPVRNVPSDGLPRGARRAGRAASDSSARASSAS